MLRHTLVVPLVTNPGEWNRLKEANLKTSIRQPPMLLLGDAAIALRHLKKGLAVFSWTLPGLTHSHVLELFIYREHGLPKRIVQELSQKNT